MVVDVNHLWHSHCCNIYILGALGGKSDCPLIGGNLCLCATVFYGLWQNRFCFIWNEISLYWTETTGLSLGKWFREPLQETAEHLTKRYLLSLTEYDRKGFLLSNMRDCIKSNLRKACFAADKRDFIGYSICPKTKNFIVSDKEFFCILKENFMKKKHKMLCYWILE